MPSAAFTKGIDDARISLAQKRRELETELEEARKDARWRTGDDAERAAGRVEGLVEALMRFQGRRESDRHETEPAPRLNRRPCGAASLVPAKPKCLAEPAALAVQPRLFRSRFTQPRERT
jgi:hypothetical protein